MLADKPLKIINTDRLDGDKLIVSYSDDTTAVYGIDQLSDLKPEETLEETTSKLSKT
jgi:hypothetical protein